jgi:trk system potassium uptake protein TrkA
VVHIVVMGCGRVGSSLALALERLGHGVAVVDRDPQAFRRLGSDFHGQEVVGTGFDREVLTAAGIHRAEAFAAVSSGDNSNIIAARVARETFGVSHVVARIYDAKRAAVYERLGIPTVATVPWTTDRFLRMLLPDGVATAWRDPSGTVAIMQVHFHEDWAGRPVTELEEATEQAGHRAAGRGRRLHGRGQRHRRRRHRRRGGLPGEGVAPMRVTVAGAGAVGRSIAAELVEADHEVMLIERDLAQVEPESVPQAEWVHADACELASLEEARVQGCDVVIAATGDDKVNLVVSLLAKTEFAVRRVVARVNDPRNEWLFTDAWGVDVAVSTPRMLAAMVEEAVTVGDLVRLLTLRQGTANLVEVTLPANTPLAGRAVREVPLPREAALVAILRGGRVIVPQADDPLEPGDELMFVAGEDIEDEIQRVLKGEPA